MRLLTLRQQEESFPSTGMLGTEATRPLGPSKGKLNKGSLFVYLATVLLRLVQLTRKPETNPQCALCPDVILPTQPSGRERNGAPVHTMCLAMKLKKKSLIRTVSARHRSCPLCAEQVAPQGFYFHDGGLTVSYACTEPDHDEPYHFSYLLDSNESRWVGMWETRLRQRLKQKGFVPCCECGRQIHASEAKSLGSGWYYCGCLPDLWQARP